MTIRVMRSKTEDGQFQLSQREPLHGSFRRVRTSMRVTSESGVLDDDQEGDYDKED